MRITLTVRNKNNTGAIINSTELLSLYFYGINITNKIGSSMDLSVIDSFIGQAQAEIERYLSIKLNKQVISERLDYYRNEFNGTGFIKTRMIVNSAYKVEGNIGDQLQVRYPTQWITTNTSNNQGLTRQITIVPNSNVADLVLGSTIYGSSVVPYLGLLNSGQIGNYWKIAYLTGWESKYIPKDLIGLISKFASIAVFNVLGDIALGTAALASYSLSIDGLSQSIATTNSATNAAYGARILNYTKEIKETLNRVEHNYRGITFTAF